MKNLLKKSAVATAVAGSLMISGVASADSVLAPLVIGVQNGAQTFFSIKARGTGAANARFASSAASDLHYVWFQKGTSINDLYNLNSACTVSNNNGRISAWDMVFQRAVTDDTTAASSSFTNFANLVAGDKSLPNAYSAGNFVGFAVITDVANKNANPAVKDLANEGELSGFGYVVDAANSFVLDYKLLNNHRSKVEGDFSAGFISKKSIDYSWLPIATSTTEWLTVVTGDDMLKSESGAGKYDATVYISQDTASGSVSPRLPMGGSGVYDNDETVISGATGLRVTCMGVYNRSALMNTLQLSGTVNGGWTRMSIQNSATTGAGASTTQVASGAITYKAELINFNPTEGSIQAEAAVLADSTFATGVFGSSSVDKLDVNGNVVTPSVPGLIERRISDGALFDVGSASPAQVNRGVVSFQVETSGHLSTTPEAHPNRPY